MSQLPESISDDVPEDPIEAASYWYIQMQSDDMTDQEKATFNLWLSDPDNAVIYQRFEQLWQRMDTGSAASARDTVQHVLEHRKNAPLRVLSLAVVLGLSGFLFLKSDTGEFLTADYRSLSGSEVLVLEDRSTLVLGPGSALDVDFTDEERRIHLVRGQVSLSVQGDADWPLSVNTLHGSARALGTQFTVSVSDVKTDVEVMESRVQVCTAVSQQCTTLTQGLRTGFDAHTLESDLSVDQGFIIDLFSQTLVVEGQPATRVLKELKRYYPGYIRIKEDGLADVRVSGVFPLNDPIRALNVMADSLPVNVRQYTPWLVLVEKRD